MPSKVYDAVVIGASAGGVDALKAILPALPRDLPVPLFIAQHRNERSDGYLGQFLDNMSAIKVSEADDKEPTLAGHAYIAPAGYHLLVEPDGFVSLSVDERVNYSRPSIDVLFESAADAYKDGLIGIVLTGANADGALGLKAVKAAGGYAIVQNPQSAQSDAMPKAALTATDVDRVVELAQIAPLIVRLTAHRAASSHSTFPAGGDNE